MKNQTLIQVAVLVSVFVSGCASLVPSAESLQAEPTCKAWKDGILGSKFVADVENETADYKHSCGITGCSHVDAKYKDGNDIYTSNSGLLTLETKMGSYDGSVFKVDSSVIKTPPFPLEKDQASYSVEVAGTHQQGTVHYNKACSKRQAALAVAVLFSK